MRSLHSEGNGAVGGGAGGLQGWLQVWGLTEGGEGEW